MSQQHKIYPISYNRLKPPNVFNHQNKDIQQQTKNQPNNNVHINGNNLHQQQKNNRILSIQETQNIIKQANQNNNICIQVAHTQQLQAMQKQYQSVIRGYQSKLRTINQEYRRCKHQMEAKIKQLFKQKNHWFNIATSAHPQYSKIQNTHNFSKNRQKCYDCDVEHSCQDSSTNQKQLIEMLQKEKKILLEQKQQILKSIQKLNLDNNNLKDRINQDAKQITRLKYQIRQNQLIIQKSQQNRDHRNPHNKTPPRKNNTSQPKKQSSPIKQSSHSSSQHGNMINIHPQALRDLEYFKISNDKYRYLVNSLNQQLILDKIKRLNQKYQKNPGISYSSGNNKGFLYPLNVVSISRKSSCYSSFQGN